MDRDTALLRELLCWHMLQDDARRAIRNLREQVVIRTGRVDLANIPSDDISLRTHLVEALTDFMDGRTETE